MSGLHRREPAPSRRQLDRAREKFVRNYERFGFDDDRTRAAMAEYRAVLDARINAEGDNDQEDNQ